MTDAELSEAVSMASHKVTQAMYAIKSVLSLDDCDKAITELVKIGHPTAVRAGAYEEALRNSDRYRAQALEALNEARAALKAIGA